MIFGYSSANEVVCIFACTVQVHFTLLLGSALLPSIASHPNFDPSSSSTLATIKAYPLLRIHRLFGGLAPLRTSCLITARAPVPYLCRFSAFFLAILHLHCLSLSALPVGSAFKWRPLEIFLSFTHYTLVCVRIHIEVSKNSIIAQHFSLSISLFAATTPF